MLESFLRGVVMPTWFAQASSKAEFLNLVPAAFEGKHAVLALVSPPGASPLMDMKTGRRLDSKRGLVAFFHGRWVYVLGTETRSGWALAGGSTGATPPDSAWAGFAGSLQRMFGPIAFAE